MRAAVNLGSLSACVEIYTLSSVSSAQREEGTGTEACTTCHCLLCSPGDPKIHSGDLIKSENSSSEFAFQSILCFCLNPFGPLKRADNADWVRVNGQVGADLQIVFIIQFL